MHYLDLSGNKIQTVLYNTSKVSYRSQPLKLNLKRNKMNCSCEFYTNYMSMVDNGEINFSCDENECLDCLSESTLSRYQWGDARKLKTKLKDNKLCSSAEKPIAGCLTLLSLFTLIKFLN